MIAASQPSAPWRLVPRSYNLLCVLSLLFSRSIAIEPETKTERTTRTDHARTLSASLGLLDRPDLGCEGVDVVLGADPPTSHVPRVQVGPTLGGVVVRPPPPTTTAPMAETSVRG